MAGYRNTKIKDWKLDEISIRIKKLREKANETQGALADAINCTPDAIKNIEQSKNAPSLDTCKAIALHYNVSIDYICGLTEDITIPSNVLDCLCRFISLEIKTGHFSGSDATYKIPFISIEKTLFDYLEILARAEQFKKETLSDDSIDLWLKKETEKVENSIRCGTVDTVEYALLSKRYFTSDKVLGLLEDAFNNSEGDDGPLFGKSKRQKATQSE